jgi:lipopolysaccharide cholinephosphotransferase
MGGFMFKKRTYNISQQYDDEILNKLHNLLTEMLGDFQKICDKYNLKYFALYGTAIGAVRHHGFIPWDDDLDLGMERDDFEKFIHIANREFDEKYTLLTPKTDKNYTVAVVKMQRNDTIFISEITRTLKFNQKIFIDIFPIDHVGCGKKAVLQKNMTLIYDRLLYLRGTPYPLINAKGLKGTVYSIICYIIHYVLAGLHISSQHLYGRFDYWASKYNDKPTNNLAVFGLPTALNCIFDKSNLYPTKKVPFESGYIDIAKSNDNILHQEYGNYLQIPPKEQQINHCPDIIKFPNEEPIKLKKNSL